MIQGNCKFPLGLIYCIWSRMYDKNEQLRARSRVYNKWVLCGEWCYLQQLLAESKNRKVLHTGSEQNQQERQTIWREKK